MQGTISLLRHSHPDQEGTKRPLTGKKQFIWRNDDFWKLWSCWHGCEEPCWKLSALLVLVRYLLKIEAKFATLLTYFVWWMGNQARNEMMVCLKAYSNFSKLYFLLSEIRIYPKQDQKQEFYSKILKTSTFIHAYLYVTNEYMTACSSRQKKYFFKKRVARQWKMKEIWNKTLNTRRKNCPFFICSSVLHIKI